MKKAVLVLCALMSLLTFADSKILQCVFVPDMTFLYECDLKAIGAIEGVEEKLEKIEDVPFSDALKLNASTEKMLKALGLDPKKDLLKLNMVAALTAEQLSGMKSNAKLDKVPFCGAVETLKPIDVKAAPEAITTYLSEVGAGGTCTPFKVGELTGLKLKLPPSDKNKIDEISLVFPADGKGLVFGTDELARAAIERYVSGKLNPLPFSFEELKKISKPNSHYCLLFKMPSEVQADLKNKAIAEAQNNPMEAGILGEIANVAGFSFTCNVVEKGLEIVISTLLPTPENAMSFKNTLLDGLFKPMLTMLVTQYAQQQLNFIEGMKTVLDGKVARIETLLTYDDIKGIAGVSGQLPMN